MFFYIVMGTVMTGCFVGMVICAKKQHTSAIAKPLAVGLLLAVVVCTILILTRSLGGGDATALIANEMKFAKSGAFILGQELAKVKPGAKVLVIVNPDSQMDKRQQVLIEGLKEGFGSAITDVTIKSPNVKKPKLPKGQDPEMMMEMPFEELVKADDINKLLSQNRSCNIIVSLIGLPMDMANLKIWEQFEDDPKKTPRLSLLFGDISMLYPAIKGGLIPACVSYKPDAVYSEDAAPDDMQAAFDVRYILITPKNVDQLNTKYPKRLFRMPK